MRNFIKIDINTTSPDETDILIAELSENDFYAFEQDENHLSAYIKEEDFTEEKMKALLPDELHYKYSCIGDRNWNEEWESGFQPVIVGDFAGIRASFHEPLKGVKNEIIITPKMSFGTGHHATTYLMVEQMEKISFKNKSVLDFGTGTGILAILAEKLGAASVIAIDHDEWSINNAGENIAINDCKCVSLEKRDNIEGLSFVNIILANINYNILAQNAPNFSTLLGPASILIISGFLVKDEAAILRIFVKNNFFRMASEHKNDWVVMVFKKC